MAPTYHLCGCLVNMPLVDPGSTPTPQWARSFHHPSHPSRHRVPSSLLRLREGKQPAQGHPVRKRQEWTQIPDQLMPKPVTLLSFPQ